MLKNEKRNETDIYLNKLPNDLCILSLFNSKTVVDFQPLDYQFNILILALYFTTELINCILSPVFAILYVFAM